MTATETEATTLQKGFIGQSVPRKEDGRLVQGQGQFFDDVKRHGMGYLHFVRSPYAHAKILSIDVTEALRLVVQQFADCIATGKTPITDGHAGLRVVGVLEAATRSMKAHGKSERVNLHARAAVA